MLVGRYSAAWIALFILFAVTSGLYLHRVPGLIGDEGSEGENTFNILDKKEITFVGERSYIGPLIDYVRVPFILAGGYTTLALRLPVYFASLAAFGMTTRLLRTYTSPLVTLFTLVGLFFSPTVLLYQRLGWAITLIPFFVVAMIYAAFFIRHQRPLLVGFIAGLGLHTHLLFAAALAPLALVGAFSAIIKRQARTWWPALLGFAAAFGTQMAVLQLHPEDQGGRVIPETMLERAAALWSLWPRLVSGSVYIAAFRGAELPLEAVWIIVSVLLILGACAFIFKDHRTIASVWLAGIGLHLLALTFMTDRWTIRYGVLLVIAVWGMAGFGAGILTARLSPRAGRLTPWIPIVCAGALSLFSIFYGIIPFLRTGGESVFFQLQAGRTSRELLIDAEPLIQCLRGQGSIFAKDIHILNRLLYRSHDLQDLIIADAWPKAQWHISLVDNQSKMPGDICSRVSHFVVIKNLKAAQ